MTPDDPVHKWYYNTDDDKPMGEPGSSEPVVASVGMSFFANPLVFLSLMNPCHN
jgi:hypothetical protein